MKFCLIILILAAIAFADWKPPGRGFVCTCTPGPPVCASNGQTYAGECNMVCAQNWIEERIYVVHNGPCYPGQ